MASAPFRRTKLAQDMAGQLLHPGPLDQHIQSGLFLSGQRRVGKTTFLKFDLIPALEQQGALVLYVDLWSQPQANPAKLVNTEIRRTLTELSTPQSALMAKLKTISQAEIGAVGFKFSVKLDQLGAPDGGTLAQAFTELVDQAKTNVVLIIDEVQHALGSPQGNELLYALKAARDAVNARPGTPGRFCFVGTGSHRAQVQELVVKGNQAFQGALTLAFPVLEEDFVAFVLDQSKGQLGTRMPSQAAAYEAFKVLGFRPEELWKALAALLRSPSELPPDAQLPVITQTLRTNAASVELARVESLGTLAIEVFSRICLADQPIKGLYAAQALTDYSTLLGRAVPATDVQAALLALSDANLVMRIDQGRYEVSDPFVKEAWRERLALQGTSPAQAK
jgi:hypothetical protein